MVAIAAPSVAAAAAKPKYKVLVFSKTAAFRHASIPTGVEMVERLGAAHGFQVDVTEDASVFKPNQLRKYAAVVFMSTTGDVLGNNQQRAFEDYIGDGGGYVGIHAASDTEYDWPFYGDLVGAYFEGHPAQQDVVVKVTDRTHPSTKRLPDRWLRFDELYNFRTNPRGDVHVLAAYDESTYNGGTMGSDHPISWCQEFAGGRSWYTGMGHTDQSFWEPAFRRHVLGGIQWAADRKDGDCGGTVDSRYQDVQLADVSQTGEPMALAVLPDGRVLFTARSGEIRLHDPATGLNTMAARLPVYTHDEDGLHAVALDPDFAKNRWVYVYRSLPGNTPVDDPATPDVNEGDAPLFGTQADWNRFRGTARLSRFKLDLEDGTLSLGSEQRIIDVQTDRGICCHMGGKLEFDNRGNLYMSTGDDTNPFESDGYTPIDERDDRNPAFDAQRTSGNTNDLRGKLLRIRPRERVAGYDIPPGNLFPAGAPQTRPEIYAMGLRNPFRFSVDAETGDVYLADYSPDARAADPLRGPTGQGRWTIIRRPGNYGWPYCATRELPYVDYDFATEESGASFNCFSPVNDSPHNTGLRRLPTVVQPDVWYSYGASSAFPSLGQGGIAPMAGPAYQFDRNSASRTKFPRSLDGVPLFAEWSRDRVWEMHIGDDGRMLSLDPLLNRLRPWDNVMDMQFGPDGSLYLLNYDDGFYSANPGAELARIDYVRGNRSPIVDASADVTVGSTPLQVRFSSAGTSDPDGDRLSYAWDFDADGTVDSTAANPVHTFEENGVFESTLRVEDRTGRYGRASVRVAVGNEPPTVEIVAPAPGLAFDWGDAVAYEISVSDDRPVDCSKVTMAYGLGHNNHTHPLQTAAGCTGTITTSLASGHSPDDNLRAVFTASYTDAGADGDVPPLTGTSQVVLTPAG